MNLSFCFPDSYVIADIETSGLNPSSDNILEIAIANVTDRRIKSIESFIINPHYPRDDYSVPPIITELTGIDSDMVRNGVSPETALSRYAVIASNSSVYFHNGIRFDIPFITAEASRHSAPLPVNTTYLDSAALFKAYRLDRIDEITYYPDFESFAAEILNTRVRGLKYNLAHCCECLSIDIANHIPLHRAESDVKATHAVIEELRALLASD